MGGEGVKRLEDHAHDSRLNGRGGGAGSKVFHCATFESQWPGNVLSYYARQNVRPLYSLTAEWELFVLTVEHGQHASLIHSAVYHLSIIIIGLVSQ